LALATISQVKHWDNGCQGVRPSSSSGSAGNPAIPYLGIRSFDRRPGNAVRSLLLARIADMGREGMIECLTIDVPRMRWQMPLHREGKIIVASVRHDR
jgi:hypothetical protein